MSTTLLTNQVPSITNNSDGGTSYELGMKFQSSSPGQILAIRYYKASSESGTHIGKIWSSTGALLASVTFTNETGSGWQQQALTAPVNIQANTTYTVSVNVNTHYAVTQNQLATSIVNGTLSSIAGNNGVYGNAGTFPTNSHLNSNYYRDIVFNPVPVPTISKVSGDNQTGVVGTTLPNPLVVKVLDSGNNPQAGVTVNFSVTNGGSASPTSAVTDSNGQASTVLTLGQTPDATHTVTATASGIGSVTFSALASAPNNPNQTLLANQVPSITNNSDGGTSYELGMKFKSSKVGQILAIRYYKASSESGIHIGKIWSSNGDLLASVTFTNETGSGWKKQALDAPLNIAANTTYVVSVNINSHYVLTQNGLAAPITNGDLSSIADGNNGVYGNPGTFPTNSYLNSNYFRDVVFNPVPVPTITIVSGDNQVGGVGNPLPEPFVVQVENASGNPQSGVTVYFAVGNGGGSVSTTSAVTNNSGRASTILTLGQTVGTVNTVTATAVDIGSVTFAARSQPATINPIYQENLLPGTTDWQLNNYASVYDISGYAAATSVNQGGTLPIKVSVGEPAQFTIDVYRLGYYGGKGGRLVHSSGPLNGITQPACSLDSTTGLVECNWSTSYTLNVSTDWTSGLYVAKLTNLANGSQAQVWFVVRNDSSTADILFQSCFNTFQAYNNLGGYSLYAWNSTNGQKAVKVSFDRPFTVTNGQMAWHYDSMIRHQRHMVRWLESQGYDVTYATNIDVMNNPQLLRRHKTFLVAGHDEYWTMTERNAAEQARDANPPVNMAFFCANTCYWVVRFENSKTTNTPNRVMVCYKSNNDPVSATNKFRLVGRPENALLGIMYTGEKTDMYNTWNNLNTPYYAGFDFVVTNSSDPYYANTNLQNGDRLSNLVGFEWDAIVNNGAAPNNLVILGQSPVSPANLDGDLPAGTNTQISHAVRYTAASGAKVFSVGSIHWMFGLDTSGSSTNLEDVRAKQMMVNILADMGTKPVTPDADIVVPL